MKNLIQNPPYIRSKESNQTMMIDVIIALSTLYVMAGYFYGKRAIYLGIVSVCVCYILDTLCVILSGKVPNIRDLSTVVTGMIIPLLLPATISFEIVCAAGIFAILVVKQPFGGVGQNIFNPAAAGVAFAIVCWPKSVFSYSVPLERLPTVIDDTIKIVASPAKALMLRGVPTQDLQSMILGNVPGAMGAVNIMVLVACLLFLVVRKNVNFSVTASFIGGAAIAAALFPRADMMFLQSVAYELMSGLLLISAVFLINDPVTSPKRAYPGMIYGFFGGVLSMTFRHIGRFEESVLFAILIMNASVWIIDLWGEKTAHRFRRKEIETNKNKEIQENPEDDFGPVSE